MLEPASGPRRHGFIGRSIDLPAELTQAQLDGRACIHCAAEDQPMRPVEAWSELSSQLFECVDASACAIRRGECSHWRRGPIPDIDLQECVDCGGLFASDG